MAPIEAASAAARPAAWSQRRPGQASAAESAAASQADGSASTGKKAAPSRARQGPSAARAVTARKRSASSAVGGQRRGQPRHRRRARLALPLGGGRPPAERRPEQQADPGPHLAQLVARHVEERQGAAGGAEQQQQAGRGQPGRAAEQLHGEGERGAEHGWPGERWTDPIGRGDGALTWPAMSENRQHGRAPIELKVDYRKLNSFFADYTKNISKGGTYIKTKKSLPNGTLFIFRLSIPGRTSAFELNGEVVRSATSGEEPGMGIRFLWGNELERIEFERVVEQLMEQSLGRELTGNLLRHAHSGKSSGEPH